MYCCLVVELAYSFMSFKDGLVNVNTDNYCDYGIPEIGL